MQTENDVTRFKGISSSDKTRWMEIVELWQTSQESQRRFCQRRQLPFNTFAYWRGKYIEAKGKAKKSQSNKRSKSPTLVPISLKETLSPSETSLTMTIQTRQGFAIHIPYTIDAKHLTTLLHPVPGFVVEKDIRNN